MRDCIWPVLKPVAEPGTAPMVAVASAAGSVAAEGQLPVVVVSSAGCWARSFEAWSVRIATAACMPLTRFSRGAGGPMLLARVPDGPCSSAPVRNGRGLARAQRGEGRRHSPSNMTVTEPATPASVSGLIATCAPARGASGGASINTPVLRARPHACGAAGLLTAAFNTFLACQAGSRGAVQSSAERVMRPRRADATLGPPKCGTRPLLLRCRQRHSVRSARALTLAGLTIFPPRLSADVVGPVANARSTAHTDLAAAPPRAAAISSDARSADALGARMAARAGFLVVITADITGVLMYIRAVGLSFASVLASRLPHSRPVPGDEREAQRAGYKLVYWRLASITALLARYYCAPSWRLQRPLVCARACWGRHGFRA